MFIPRRARNPHWPLRTLAVGIEQAAVLAQRGDPEAFVYLSRRLDNARMGVYNDALLREDARGEREPEAYLERARAAWKLSFEAVYEACSLAQVPGPRAHAIEALQQLMRDWTDRAREGKAPDVDQTLALFLEFTRRAANAKLDDLERVAPRVKRQSILSRLRARNSTRRISTTTTAKTQTP